MKLFIIMFGLLSLYGCALPIDENDVLGKAACCNKLDQIEYIEADSQLEMEFSIDDDKPVFDFPQGASHFYAVKLRGDNRQFLLRSFFHWSEFKRFASPVLLELDADYHILSHRELALELVEEQEFEEPHMIGLLELKENTEHLIIYPANSNGSKTKLTVAIADGGSATVTSGVESVFFPSVKTRLVLNKVPTGRMELVPASLDKNSNIKLANAR